MNSSWSRISGNSVLNLSQTLTRELSSSREDSTRRDRGRATTPRPPSFADEMTASTSKPSLPTESRVSLRRDLSANRLYPDLEETISELRSDLLQKSNEITRLRSALHTAANQRADLLKESELLRHTVSELKAVHRREVAELKAQLASECARRAAADRQLAEAYVGERPLELRAQVERLAVKMQLLEEKQRLQSAHITEPRLSSEPKSRAKENYSPLWTDRPRGSKSPHPHRRS